MRGRWRCWSRAPSAGRPSRFFHRTQSSISEGYTSYPRPPSGAPAPRPPRRQPPRRRRCRPPSSARRPRPPAWRCAARAWRSSTPKRRCSDAAPGPRPHAVGAPFTCCRRRAERSYTTPGRRSSATPFFASAPPRMPAPRRGMPAPPGCRRRPGDAGAAGTATQAPGGRRRRRCERDGAAGECRRRLRTAPGCRRRPAGPAGSECDFIEAFLERFSFFLETTDSAGVAPFPAVVPR